MLPVAVLLVSRRLGLLLTLALAFTLARALLAAPVKLVPDAELPGEVLGLGGLLVRLLPADELRLFVPRALRPRRGRGERAGGDQVGDGDDEARFVFVRRVRDVRHDLAQRAARLVVRRLEVVELLARACRSQLA